MDLDRLSLFLHIVDAGSMTAASSRAHLTQPAISRAVHRLEDEVGAPLFRKEGRGITLTAAGRALVPRARALLEAHRQATLEVKRTAERGYWDVRVGSVDSVASFVLPAIVGRVATEFPHLAVRLTTGRTASLLERVERGALDLALVASSGALESVGRRLGPYELAYYGAADRFPSLAKAKTLDELRRFPLVEIEPPPGQAALAPDEHLSHAVVSTAATVKALVLSGVGVGDLTPFMLARDERRRLVRAKVPHDPTCAVWLVVSRGWAGPAEQRLAQWLGDEVRRAIARAR